MMGLLQMPPELLLRISDHLTTKELGHFRSSCRHVESVLFDTFAKEFFSKRQFMLEDVSLQVLVAIAKHPTLSRWLSHVIIGAEAFRHDPDYSDDVSKARYLAGHVERSTLVATGQACDMLTEAFSKLPHLQTVGLRDYAGGAQGSGRERDGPGSTWKSYGWSFGLSEDAEEHLQRYGRPRTTMWTAPDTMLPIIIHALAKANAQPESIEVFLRKDSELRASSFNVFNGPTATGVASVLKDMKTLMLSISIGSQSVFGVPPQEMTDDDPVSLPLQHFLTHTPSLECLRLNFHMGSKFAEHVLQWLGRPCQSSLSTHGRRHLPSIALERLTSLDLGMMTVNGSTLVKLVAKFNLHSLNLWKVAVKHESDTSIKESLWSRLLTGLSDALGDNTSLHSVMIGFPSQAAYPDVSFGAFGPGHMVQFVADGDPDNLQPENLLRTVKYQASFGSNVKDWLQETASKAVVPDFHRQTPVVVSESESGAGDATDYTEDYDDVDGDEVDEDEADDD